MHQFQLSEVHTAVSIRPLLIFVLAICFTAGSGATYGFAQGVSPDPVAEGRAAIDQANSVPANDLFQHYLRGLGISAAVSGCRLIQTDHVAKDVSYAAVCKLRTTDKVVDVPMCGDTLVGKFVLDGGFYSPTAKWVSSFLEHDCPAGG